MLFSESPHYLIVEYKYKFGFLLHQPCYYREPTLQRWLYGVPADPMGIPSGAIFHNWRCWRPSTSHYHHSGHSLLLL